MRRPVQAVIVQGVTGGILAGLVVALWFLVADAVAGQPFRTPALLAGALLHSRFPQPTFRLVAAYTVLHFGVFALLGVAMARVSAAFAAPHRLLLGVAFGLVLQEIVFYAGLLLSGVPLLRLVPWPHVFGANIASGLVLMSYLHYAERDPRPFGPGLLREHPLLMRGLVTGLIGAGAVAVWFFGLDLAVGAPPVQEVRSLETLTGTAGVRVQVRTGFSVRVDGTVVRSRPVLSRRGFAIAIERRF